MLAERLPNARLQEIVARASVVIETKFDGERIQCHMQEGSVKFFSRNSNNYSHIYGPKMNRFIAENVNA